MASLTDVTDATVRAYRSDLVAFSTWAARSGVTDPAGVDRPTVWTLSPASD